MVDDYSGPSGSQSDDYKVMRPGRLLKLDRGDKQMKGWMGLRASVTFSRLLQRFLENINIRAHGRAYVWQ